MYLCVCVFLQPSELSLPLLWQLKLTGASMEEMCVSLHHPSPSLSPSFSLSPLLPPSFCPLSPSSLPSLFCFSLSLILSSFHFSFSSVGKIIDQLTDLGQAGRGCSASCRACLEEWGGGSVLPGHRSPDDRLQWWWWGTKEPVGSSCP